MIEGRLWLWIDRDSPGGKASHEDQHHHRFIYNGDTAMYISIHFCSVNRVTTFELLLDRCSFSHSSLSSNPLCKTEEGILHSYNTGIIVICKSFANSWRWPKNCCAALPKCGINRMATSHINKPCRIPIWPCVVIFEVFPSHCPFFEIENHSGKL